MKLFTLVVENRSLWLHGNRFKTLKLCQFNSKSETLDVDFRKIKILTEQFSIFRQRRTFSFGKRKGERQTKEIIIKLNVAQPILYNEIEFVLAYLRGIPKTRN